MRYYSTVIVLLIPNFGFNSINYLSSVGADQQSDTFILLCDMSLVCEIDCK